MKHCNWEYIETIKNYYKWVVKTDCGHEIIVTNENKYGKLINKSCQPHLQGNDPDAKCIYCGKEINVYSEENEKSWRNSY